MNFEYDKKIVVPKNTGFWELENGLKFWRISEKYATPAHPINPDKNWYGFTSSGFDTEDPKIFLRTYMHDTERDFSEYGSTDVLFFKGLAIAFRDWYLKDQNQEQIQYPLFKYTSSQKIGDIFFTEIAEMAVKFTQEEIKDRPAGLNEKLITSFSNKDQFDTVWELYRRLLSAELYYILEIDPYLNQKGHPSRWVKSFPKFEFDLDRDIQQGPKIIERVNSGEMFNG